MADFFHFVTYDLIQTTTGRQFSDRTFGKFARQRNSLSARLQIDFYGNILNRPFAVIMNTNVTSKSFPEINCPKFEKKLLFQKLPKISKDFTQNFAEEPVLRCSEAEFLMQKASDRRLNATNPFRFRSNLANKERQRNSVLPNASLKEKEKDLRLIIKLEIIFTFQSHLMFAR